MTENSEYTLSGDGLMWKNSGFKIGYPKTFTIAVPSGVAVSKIAITGYSSNTSTGTGITVGSTTKTFKTLATEYFDIASPSAGANVTFTSASKEMYMMSISLYTDEGITLKTTANMDGWRAFYESTSQKYEVDGNTKIYIATETDDDDVVQLTAVAGTIIPANAPVILKTSALDYTIYFTRAPVRENILSLVSTTIRPSFITLRGAVNCFSVFTVLMAVTSSSAKIMASPRALVVFTLLLSM